MARQEAFARRERDRINTARRRFEDWVKQQQKFLERWAREGSEPKTAKERAFRAFVRFLEIFDEVNTAWDKTHKFSEAVNADYDQLEALVRQNWHLVADERKKGIIQQFQELDQELLVIQVDLQEFDKEFVEGVIAWGDKFETLNAEVGQATSWQDALARHNKVALHFTEFKRLQDKWLRRTMLIQWAINNVAKRVSPAPQVHIGPRQTGMNEP